MQETEKEFPSKIVFESLEHSVEELRRVLKHEAGRPAAALHTTAVQCTCAHSLRVTAFAELVLGYPRLDCSYAKRLQHLQPQEAACTTCSIQETFQGASELVLPELAGVYLYSRLSCTAKRRTTEPLQDQEAIYIYNPPVSCSDQLHIAPSELVVGFHALKCSLTLGEHLPATPIMAEETSPSASELVTCIDTPALNITSRARVIQRHYAPPMQETDYFASAEMVAGELKCRVIFEDEKTSPELVYDSEAIQHRSQ